MSEYIDNTQKRKEIIKNILKELNQGKSIEQVKKEFEGLLDGVDAPSITEVEQMLIDEGTPAEEIQRLCDVHATFFKESLEQTPAPQNLPGHPVHTFLAENKAVVPVLDELKNAFAQFKKSPDQAHTNVVQGELKKLMQFELHFVRLENLLFPVLEKSGFFGPSQVMWGIHNDIRADWKKLEQAFTAVPLAAQIPELETIANRMDTAIRELAFKEEKILFPTALERLKEEEWKAIHKQESEVGFAFIKPGIEFGLTERTASAAQPEKVAAAPVSIAADAIHLDTGVLTPAQINLLLKTLPVDVTFVDENDQVRFFSQTRERIFQRSPAIIGRKVQNCHPPQSMGKVQQILDDFKAGRRDVAEFWIQLGGKFVVIQYYAVRDENKVYKGTIEVSQDANHLRSLQGEKRLLEDIPVK